MVDSSAFQKAPKISYKGCLQVQVFVVFKPERGRKLSFGYKVIKLAS